MCDREKNVCHFFVDYFLIDRKLMHMGLYRSFSRLNLGKVILMVSITVFTNQDDM